LGRLKGSCNKNEAKNRIVKLRVTAREWALAMKYAIATNHSLSQIMRFFIEEGLTNHHNEIRKVDKIADYYSFKRLNKRINCGPKYNVAKRYFGYSNSNSNSIPLPIPDKLDHSLSSETEPPLPLENTDTAGILPDPMLDTKEAWIKKDAYLAFLEDSLTASFKEKQPSEAGVLNHYNTCCKKGGIEPGLLFSQTLSLEQRYQREAKK